MEKLLPDRLKELWQSVDRNQMAVGEFTSEQERLVTEYCDTWTQALLLEGHGALQESLLKELCVYLECQDVAEIQRRCSRAVAMVKTDWQQKVEPRDPRSVERFYDESESYLYDLMGWHTLCDDDSPLAYVVALEFARQQSCRSHLDFGSGVGSGSILFARHGYRIALADISSSMLDFSQWRIEQRHLPAQFYDLKEVSLPRATFDIVTAMDVFEHLVDPVGTVDDIARALKPGGFLFGRFHAEPDENHPQHIVLDFGPTFQRLQELGLTEVWRDEWLWGHQVFQKP